MGIVLEGLVPGVQALIVIGAFILLMVAACNRRAAINLTLFLHDLRDLVQDRVNPPSRVKHRRQPGKIISAHSYPPSNGGDA
jgi:hypothetical protein